MKRVMTRTNSTTHRSDAVLLHQARTDPQAFRTVYDRHAEPLYRFFLKRVGNHHGALDLTAETFAQAWSSRARFVDQRGGNARPWLFGIARNVLLRSLRQERLADDACTRLGLQVAATEAITPDQSWVDGLDDDVEQALADLPADQREAIELRVVHDHDYETVAAIQHTTPGAARVRVHRGLRSIRASADATTKGTTTP